MTAQLRNNFIDGFNYYVPAMQHQAEKSMGGLHQFSLGTPSAADTDGIHNDFDADDATQIDTTMVPGSGTEGSETTARYGRNVTMNISADPGATGFVGEVRGRDYLGQFMRERFTVANGATTQAVGKKAFKKIDSIRTITAATNAVTADFGWGTYFGLPYVFNQIDRGLEGNYPADFGPEPLTIETGVVTIADAATGTVLAPYNGVLIGTYGVVTTAVTVAVAAISVTVDAVAKAAFNMTAPIAAAGFRFDSTADYADQVPVDEGDAVVFTSDGGPTAGAANLFAVFSQGGLELNSPVYTDPQTISTGDPRGLIKPSRTPDGVIEFIYWGIPDNRVNTSNNGGLHGIRHYNG